MDATRSTTGRVVLAGILGAIGGGLLVAIATRAIPKMMSWMMQNMIGQMRENGVNPAEICAQMMKNCGQGRSEDPQPEQPGG